MTSILVQKDGMRITFGRGFADFGEHVDLVKVTYDRRPSLSSKGALIVRRMRFLGKVTLLTVGC